ncbi:MAG TPA: DUF6580 family putative transport protein [Terriglobales bacterium]|jgi:hypothetical protein|nr:DUF6580 family putative transport protein [Terriglobales bacterium]
MLAYLFVLIAFGVRFLPQTLGFTPVAASLLFFGARGSKRQMWFPLLLMAASDVYLTIVRYAYPLTWDHYVTWAWYAAILWFGTGLRENARPLRVIGAALASSVSFFLISNFMVWASGTMYPKTLSGLTVCYTLGLPFFRRGIEGDLLFTCVMFLTPALLHYIAGITRKSDQAAAA